MEKITHKKKSKIELKIEKDNEGKTSGRRRYVIVMWRAMERTYETIWRSYYSYRYVFQLPSFLSNPNPNISLFAAAIVTTKIPTTTTTTRGYQSNLHGKPRIPREEIISTDSAKKLIT